jgi:hypothetical protein
MAWLWLKRPWEVTMTPPSALVRAVAGDAAPNQESPNEDAAI